jgi:hypothetical protein
MGAPCCAAFLVAHVVGLRTAPQAATDLLLCFAQPRAEAALAEHLEEGLPWDLVAAACMLDAAAGAAAAGGFWAQYAAALLPRPGELTLPLLLRDDALAALHDADVAAAAREQRARLAAVLPSLAAAKPHSLAWGFGVVRSRAFALGGDVFACVPFLDLANHAADPTAEVLQPFDEDGSPTPGAQRHPDDALPCIRLLARKALPRGAEVTLCYSGADTSYSNARLMAQHGFVPEGGNRAERLPLGESLPQGAQPLCLEWLQATLGDAAWMDMLLGGDARLYAALASLPTRNEPLERTRAHRDAQLALTRQLAAECAAAAAAAPSSLAEDEAALAAAEGAGDAHMAAALRYRLERKRLWARAAALLAQHERALAAPL